MSTAVDAAFEELIASPREAPEETHLTCGYCHPRFQPGSVALCGHVNAKGLEPEGQGRPHCADCLALRRRPPCGHP